MHRSGTTVRRCVAVATAALALTACTGDGDPPTATDAPTETSTPTPSPEATTPSEDPTTEAADTETPSAEVDEPAEPIVVAVDFEQRAEGGTTIRVSRFEVTETNVLVDVEIIVAAERAFVQFNNTQQNPAKVVDDLGTEYTLVPPEDNRSLHLDGGEHLEGTLAFQGPVDREASTLQLIFNSRSNAEPETVNDQIQPRFEFSPVELEGSGQDG